MTTCFSARFPHRSASDCGPRTSRPRSSARRASSANVRRRRGARRDRALPGHRPGGRLDAVRDDAELAGARPHDLSSLRILFTGGEMVPYERASEFEQRTGAGVSAVLRQQRDRRAVGDHSRRSARAPAAHRGARDPRDARSPARSRHRRRHHRNRRAGSARGQGPDLCLGYWDDAAANDALFTADGWMRMGDLATIDADGYLTVVGRTSDVIIRGGKNISAAEVEDDVGSHPAVALCAVVAMPDATFGERVCVFVELRAGYATFDARRAARAPRAAGHRQGALARTPRRARRAAEVVGRQDRERRASESRANIPLAEGVGGGWRTDPSPCASSSTSSTPAS